LSGAVAAYPITLLKLAAKTKESLTEISDLEALNQLNGTGIPIKAKTTGRPVFEDPSAADEEHRRSIAGVAFLLEWHCRAHDAQPGIG
jgi:hypothetical protein